MNGLDGFAGIVLSLLIGYVIALAVYMGATFALARFARHALVAEGHPLPGFYVASAMAWLFATLFACYTVTTIVPYSWEIALMALVLLIVLLRSTHELNMQNAKGLMLLCAVTIVGGAIFVWLLVS